MDDDVLATPRWDSSVGWQDACGWNLCGVQKRFPAVDPSAAESQKMTRIKDVRCALKEGFILYLTYSVCTTVQRTVCARLFINPAPMPLSESFFFHDGVALPCYESENI